MNIFLGILAVILLLGMIGDKEQQNRNNYTQGFIIVIFAIVAMNVIPLIL